MAPFSAAMCPQFEDKNALPITVQSLSAQQFQQRWDDYCQVLEDGTDSAIGRSEPRPDDVRDEVRDLRGLGTDSLRKAVKKAREEHRQGQLTEVQLEEALEAAYAPRVTAVQLDEAGVLLETVWKKDERRWPRRLALFLASLLDDGRGAFTDLVKKGCQPDMLALSFHNAAGNEARGLSQQRLVRDELNQLEQLGADARSAFQAFVNRRRQLDEYFTKEGLRVADPEVSVLADRYDENHQVLERQEEVGALADLCAELDQVLERQRDDLRRIRRQIDGRRQLFYRHPLIRLWTRVHRSTKFHNDSKVDQVVANIRAARGLEPYGLGTLKKRRTRWYKGLE